MVDVVVVGGGVIGLSIAWELARCGQRVEVLDQGRAGREASWAGAGMLPPGSLSGARTPEARLRSFSHLQWSDWTARLAAETGIDNGFRNCASINVSVRESLASEIAVWKSEGVAVESLSGDAAREVEPALATEITDAYRLPEFSQVRNPRHLKAVAAACEKAGVLIRAGQGGLGWRIENESVVSALTPAGEVRASQFVVATGAWSRGLLEAAGQGTTIEPVRGQIVLLQTRRSPFSHVLQVGPRYLVPRPDGRILIGSTEERVGFVKQNTVEGVSSLLKFATSLVPGLKDAEIERCWSGLRPGSVGDTPLLGRVPHLDNLFVATGHFRSGLQMSPGTAVLMRQLLLRQEPGIDVTPFAVDRSSSESATRK